MSDIPQGYNYMGVDKGYIEVEGQTFCFNDYPLLFKILTERVPQMIAKYTEEDKSFNIHKQNMGNKKDINPNQ